MTSSILTLQRRFRELGRIRLGEKGTTAGGKQFPKKLAGFRLTSASQETLLVAASLYGGEVRRWVGAPTETKEGGGVQWELYMGDRIDVLLPPGEVMSQAFELWSGGGCVRRCNGQTAEDGEPCVCPADIEERMAAAAKGAACKPTTRLTVILPRLPDIGVWRMESHGYNAAVELPGTVELLKVLAGAGRMIPAFLRVDQRTSVKDGETRKFVVPVLELPSVTVAELQAGGGTLALGEGSTPALPAPAVAALPAPAAARSAAAPAAPAAVAPRPPLPGERPADEAFVNSLAARLQRLEPKERRVEAKAGFVERFGVPHHLAAGQAAAAEVYVAGWENAPAVEAAAPESAEAAKEAKPRKPLTTPAKLHIHAKGCGLSEGDLDDVILDLTGGRTSSAKELDEATLLKVWQACELVRDGMLNLGKLRAAVQAWRDQQPAPDAAPDATLQAS